MAFFLKKSHLKKGLYLQIYESFYDPSRKQSAHKSHGAIGYVHELQAQGIEDPIAYGQAQVDKLNEAWNAEKKRQKKRKIGDTSSAKLLGYFPVKGIHDRLKVEKFIHLLQFNYNYKFQIFPVLSALVYARLLRPCSKHKTFYEVLPNLFESVDCSLNQVYETMDFLGNEYERIIEIYNTCVNSLYPFDLSCAYFDCTNFYFEIDREDDFRRKGPSKEHRPEPLVGMGLLLDARQIPVGMTIFPGNQSEKPYLRQTMQNLKERHRVSGRMIRVADKGLNCADNIMEALQSGDGYIFSKSVKQLPEIEQAWVLLDQDYQDVLDAKGQLIYRTKSCKDSFTYTVTIEGRKKKISLPEKRVVTYSPKLAEKQTMEIKRQIDKAANLCLSSAKRREFGDCSKYVVFQAIDAAGKETDNDIAAALNEEAINKSLQLAGYNMIVTSEVDKGAKEIYSIYHNLWRIEHSFRVMKSDLDARPVYLQKEHSIKGHFLICYLALLLLRLFEVDIAQEDFSAEQILTYMREFTVTKVSETKFVNQAKQSDFLSFLADKTKLPLDNYFLNKNDIQNILSFRV